MLCSNPVGAAPLVALLALVGCSTPMASAPDLSSGEPSGPVRLAPGDVGSPCELLDQLEGRSPRGGCAVGAHCAVGTLDGETAAFCTRDLAVAIAEGQPCGAANLDGIATDLCAANLFCARGPGQSFGSCQRLCFSREQCAAGAGCVASTGSSVSRMAFFGPEYLRACLPAAACDPLDHRGCSNGERCLFSAPDDGGRVTLCTAAIGTGRNGADCSSSLDCARGYVCGPLNTCRQLCSRTVADGGVDVQCEPGLQCSPVYGYPDSVGRCN